MRDASMVPFIPNIGGAIVAVYFAAAFRQSGSDIVAFSLLSLMPSEELTALVRSGRRG